MHNYIYYCNLKNFCCLDDLKIANKKANKAKSTSELSSHNEDIKRKWRKQRKQKCNKSLNKRFSDTDASLDNSNDENIYPITSFPNSGKSTNDKYYYIVLTIKLRMHMI